jgi:hypothetical protein
MQINLYNEDYSLINQHAITMIVDNNTASVHQEPDQF